MTSRTLKQYNVRDSENDLWNNIQVMIKFMKYKVSQEVSNSKITLYSYDITLKFEL